MLGGLKKTRGSRSSKFHFCCNSRTSFPNLASAPSHGPSFHHRLARPPCLGGQLLRGYAAAWNLQRVGIRMPSWKWDCRRSAEADLTLCSGLQLGSQAGALGAVLPLGCDSSRLSPRWPRYGDLETAAENVVLLAGRGRGSPVFFLRPFGPSHLGLEPGSASRQGHTL